MRVEYCETTLTFYLREAEALHVCSVDLHYGVPSLQRGAVPSIPDPPHHRQLTSLTRRHYAKPQSAALTAPEGHRYELSRGS